MRHKRKNGNPWNGYTKTAFSCALCGTQFISYDRPSSDPKRTERRYCSQACYFKRLAGKTNPNFKGERPCIGCGVHIMGAQRMFCSRECRFGHYDKCRILRAPQDKLNRNMRRSVIRFLQKGVKASRSWRSLTGFTSDELMAHLEKQFRDGMTWDNYGSYWHLDHIKPVASFVFSVPEDAGFKKCWALSNLQPLQAVENHKKGSKYNGVRMYRCR